MTIDLMEFKKRYSEIINRYELLNLEKEIKRIFSQWIRPVEVETLDLNETMR